MPSKRTFLKAAMVIAACVAAPVQAQQKLEEVNYLLPAPAFLPAFIPWVLAQQRGYYAKEGLNVKFVVAKGGVDVAKQVGAGNAPIGGGIGDTPIIARAQGIPVKAVALLGGGSLTNLVVHADQGINGPADLKGKTVTVLAYQDTTFFSLLGMLASVGLTKSDLNIQAAGPRGIWQQFADGRAAAFAGPVDWAINARDAGAKIKIYRGDSYFPSMAQAIIASDELIQKRPDLVGKLVKATLHGLDDIMKQGKGVVPDYIAGSPNFKGKEKFIGEVVELYTEYTYKGQKVLGEMNPDRLAKVQAFYVKEGIVPKAAPVDELYTNQFVK
ncbi:MAG: ABC transporter substrate-binding protein [Betaproteobacteria bacterium]|jgi:NitT/TauT family transport system substrate-binding protein|nr:ABC transporter substrate-binding protein [Betaproteobacteria bacterium]